MRTSSLDRIERGTTDEMSQKRWFAEILLLRLKAPFCFQRAFSSFSTENSDRLSDVPFGPPIESIHCGKIAPVRATENCIICSWAITSRKIILNCATNKARLLAEIDTKTA